MLRNASAKIVAVLTASAVVVSVLAVSELRVSRADAATALPAPNALLKPSVEREMPLMLGLEYDPKHPLAFTVLFDTGDARDVSDAQAKQAIDLFLSALTTPTKDFWVNLSPTEEERVIPQSLQDTALGSVFLKQDYLLKQLSSSLTDPATETGKAYWATLGSETPAQAKVWIAPKKADFSDDGTRVLVHDAEFKVMTEAEYATGKADHGAGAALLPLIERQVNKGAMFGELRAAYRAMILASWFKAKFSESFYRSYLAKHKTAGLAAQDPAFKEKVFANYVKSFEKGVYRTRIAQRQYFSGGIAGSSIPAMVHAVGPLAPEAVSHGRVDRSSLVLNPYDRNTAVNPAPRVAQTSTARSVESVSGSNTQHNAADRQQGGSSEEQNPSKRKKGTYGPTGSIDTQTDHKRTIDLAGSALISLETIQLEFVARLDEGDNLSEWMEEALTIETKAVDPVRMPSVKNFVAWVDGLGRSSAVVELRRVLAKPSDVSPQHVKTTVSAVRREVVERLSVLSIAEKLEDKFPGLFGGWENNRTTVLIRKTMVEYFHNWMNQLIDVEDGLLAAQNTVEASVERKTQSDFSALSQNVDSRFSAGESFVELSSFAAVVASAVTADFMDTHLSVLRGKVEALLQDGHGKDQGLTAANGKPVVDNIFNGMQEYADLKEGGASEDELRATFSLVFADVQTYFKARLDRAFPIEKHVLYYKEKVKKKQNAEQVENDADKKTDGDKAKVEAAWRLSDLVYDHTESSVLNGLSATADWDQELAELVLKDAKNAASASENMKQNIFAREKNDFSEDVSSEVKAWADKGIDGSKEHPYNKWQIGPVLLSQLTENRALAEEYRDEILFFSNERTVVFTEIAKFADEFLRGSSSALKTEYPVVEKIGSKYSVRASTNTGYGIIYQVIDENGKEVAKMRVHTGHRFQYGVNWGKAAVTIADLSGDAKVGVQAVVAWAKAAAKKHIEVCIEVPASMVTDKKQLGTYIEKQGGRIEYGKFGKKWDESIEWQPASSGPIARVKLAAKSSSAVAEIVSQVRAVDRTTQSERRLNPRVLMPADVTREGILTRAFIAKHLDSQIAFVEELVGKRAAAYPPVRIEAERLLGKMIATRESLRAGIVNPAEAGEAYAKIMTDLLEVSKQWFRFAVLTPDRQKILLDEYTKGRVSQHPEWDEEICVADWTEPSTGEKTPKISVDDWIYGHRSMFGVSRLYAVFLNQGFLNGDIDPSTRYAAYDAWSQRGSVAQAIVFSGSLSSTRDYLVGIKAKKDEPETETEDRVRERNEGNPLPREKIAGWFSHVLSRHPRGQEFWADARFVFGEISASEEESLTRLKVLDPEVSNGAKKWKEEQLARRAASLRRIAEMKQREAEAVSGGIDATDLSVPVEPLKDVADIGLDPKTFKGFSYRVTRAKPAA